MLNPSLPGFIELPIWNPPATGRRATQGQTPTTSEHNPHGQGTAIVRLDRICYVLPIWEDTGDIWSHSRVVFNGGTWLDVDASFEQIEDAANPAPSETNDDHEPVTARPLPVQS
jgi:hypothetical protein